jgi:TRAP-type C4-dicarboxylate transport system permease small subunit
MEVDNDEFFTATDRKYDVDVLKRKMQGVEHFFGLCLFVALIAGFLGGLFLIAESLRRIHIASGVSMEAVIGYFALGIFVIIFLVQCVRYWRLRKKLRVATVIDRMGV